MTKRNGICKGINEAIKDERMACHVEYANLAKEMRRQGYHENAEKVERIRKQECGHHKKFKTMKKWVGCK